MALIAGCGNEAGTVPVSGRVTFRGQPLSNASIGFYPATGRPVMAAVSSGEYAVDLPRGEYKVTVNLGVDLPAGWKEGDSLPPPKLQLPAEYTTPLKSPLSASITENGAESEDFVLD